MGEWKKNLVLSNEFKVELLPWKIEQADISSVSPSSEPFVMCSDEALTLEMQASKSFHLYKLIW